MQRVTSMASDIYHCVCLSEQMTTITLRAHYVWTNVIFVTVRLTACRISYLFINTADRSDIKFWVWRMSVCENLYSSKLSLKTLLKQECIPVGCIQPLIDRMLESAFGEGWWVSGPGGCLVQGQTPNPGPPPQPTDVNQPETKIIGTAVKVEQKNNSTRKQPTNLKRKRKHSWR